MASSVSGLREAGARTAVQVEYIRKETAEIKNRLPALYPQEDARREIDRIDQRLSDHEGRLRSLEARRSAKAEQALRSAQTSGGQ